MNTQSLSASLSLSQSFVNGFKGGNQPSKNGVVENNHPAENPNRFAGDTYKSSQVTASNESKPVGPNLPIVFSKSESISLQIKTKEGDLVSISLNRLEAGNSGDLKMSQNKNDVGGEDHRKTFKSESSLNIDAGFNKGSANPVSKPSQSSNTPVERDNKQIKENDSAPPIKKKHAEVKNVSDRVKDDFNQKSTTEIKQTENSVAKADASSSKVVDNTRSGLPIANSGNNQTPTSFSRLVVSTRSVLHMNIGGNKFDATQEQNYSISPATSASVNGGMNKYAQHPLISQTDNVETEKSTVTSPNHSANTNQIDELQLPANARNEISQSSLQHKQSIDAINGDGRHYSLGSDFNISIEGDLNKEEQQSIAELLQAMGKVSQDFFQDKISSVFSQVQNMGFETEQIAGFSMNLNGQKSVQAVAAYQQIKMPDQSINSDLLSQASDFLAQAKETVASAKTAIDSFAEPEKSFTDMFAGVGQMIDEGNSADQQNDSGRLFLKMVENISQDLYSNSQMK